MDGNTKRTRDNAAKAFAPKNTTFDRIYLNQLFHHCILDCLPLQKSSVVDTVNFVIGRIRCKLALNLTFEARRLLQNRPDHPYPAIYTCSIEAYFLAQVSSCSFSGGDSINQ